MVADCRICCIHKAQYYDAVSSVPDGTLTVSVDSWTTLVLAQGLQIAVDIPCLLMVLSSHYKN